MDRKRRHYLERAIAELDHLCRMVEDARAGECLQQRMATPERQAGPAGQKRLRTIETLGRAIDSLKDAYPPLCKAARK